MQVYTASSIKANFCPGVASPNAEKHF